MRQPDIEIYLKDEDGDHKAIAQWPGDALGACREWKQKGQTWTCTAGSVAATWLPKADGQRRRLHLASAQHPWQGASASARAPVEAAHAQVRWD
ncbi:hypothetical protein EWW49_29670, partial [Pseudomonas syringae]